MVNLIEDQPSLHQLIKLTNYPVDQNWMQQFRLNQDRQIMEFKTLLKLKKS